MKNGKKKRTMWIGNLYEKVKIIFFLMKLPKLLYNKSCNSKTRNIYVHDSDERFRAVASLTVPWAQVPLFSFFFKFQSFFPIFPQTFLIFFLILVSRKGLATPLLAVWPSVDTASTRETLTLCNNKDTSYGLGIGYSCCCCCCCCLIFLYWE